MQTSLNVLLNLNKKERKMLLSSNDKKMYVIFQSSIFRCQHVAEIKDISHLDEENRIKIEIVDSLKDTNFAEILKKEVKYLDIDRRYNHDNTIYFLLKFKNEFSTNITKLKELIK